MAFNTSNAFYPFQTLGELPVGNDDFKSFCVDGVLYSQSLTRTGTAVNTGKVLVALLSSGASVNDKDSRDIVRVGCRALVSAKGDPFATS